MFHSVPCRNTTFRNKASVTPTGATPGGDKSPLPTIRHPTSADNARSLKTEIQGQGRAMPARLSGPGQEPSRPEKIAAPISNIIAATIHLTVPIVAFLR